MEVSPVSEPDSKSPDRIAATLAPRASGDLSKTVTDRSGAGRASSYYPEDCDVSKVFAAQWTSVFKRPPEQVHATRPPETHACSMVRDRHSASDFLSLPGPVHHVTGSRLCSGPIGRAG